MIDAPAPRKTLYVDTGKVGLCPDGEALRVRRRCRSTSLIPLRRIDRAIVRDNQTDLLQACLAIVRSGGTVHFQDAAGNLCGILQQPWHEGALWARRLAEVIEHTAGRAPYRRWRDTQRRHAWSLVLRRNYRGDFESNKRRLVRYLRFFRPEIDTVAEFDWLEQQLWAWLQARLDRDGLQPVVRVLETKGESLIQALSSCLLLPLIWTYVRWRRRRASAIAPERTEFFELEACARLYEQFKRHIAALENEYHAQRRIQEMHVDGL